MKKILLTLSLMLVAVAANAKDPKPCPSDYYATALNKSDQALLTELYNIITSHTDIGYDGLWDAYADTDTDSRGYYIDMYSNYDKYNYSRKCGNYSAIGDCVNREHSVPKSWWGGGKQDQYSDIFNIVPTDGYVNNQRSNYPYGVCEGGTRLTNGSYVAKGRMGYSTRSGYSGRVFEPDDEYKGDFARAYFYMAACYNNIISSWTQSGGDAFFAGNRYPVFTTYAIDLLMEWHRLDPVSEKETRRNNYAHAWQDNRNPFIDHPELAEHIWGNKKGQAWTGDGSVVVTPVLTQPASGTTINVGTIAVDGASVSTQVNVRGSNLASSLSVSVSGSGFSVTPSTLSASAVNNGATITVTYSGSAENATGTLTLTSSEVSRTVTLTAGKQQPGVDPDPDDPITPTGDYAIENWEGCASGGYWTGEVQGAAFRWYFTDAGIWAQSNDHWNDAIGCRLGKTSTSSIAMSQDVAGTSGLSFYAATYGTSDADATIQVLYSTDGGSNWTLLEELILTHDFTKYTYGLDEKRNVRFKFQQTAGKRVNIDDIAIYAPAQDEKDPQVYFGGTITPLSAVQDGESSISEVTVITEDNDDPVTVTVDGNFELSLNQRAWGNRLTLDATGETFYVRLSSTAATGEFEGTITATAGNVSAYADVEGEVTAPAVLRGDVNVDGVVNIDDVTTLIDYLLGSAVTPFSVVGADVNRDNVINIDDVTGLIDLLLGGNQMTWMALPESGGIFINNPMGEHLEVYDLDAEVVATSSASGHMTLPAGIYLVTSDNRSSKVVVK
ncbi:MAG: endonuclease [Muribaculaceae bacterium]|nr:endonuclease [Muribaculaceae bacterium]